MDQTSDPELFDAHCHLQVLGLAPCGVPRYMPTSLICASLLSDLRIIQGHRSSVVPQDSRYEGHLDEVVAAAHAAGVRRFNVQGTCEDDWQNVRRPGSTLSRVRLSMLLRPPNATVAALRRLRDRKTATP